MAVDIYSVSEVNKNIQEILESNFYDIWVEGEVSNLKYHSSGHIYFSLTDDKSNIKAVIYKSRTHKLKTKLTNGIKVVVFGSINVYLQGGSYQISVEYVRESGIGKKFYDLEKLKKQFKKNGYFERKRPISEYPRKIIVLTSISGAAVRDIIQVIKRRAAGITIYLYPVVVQGEQAKKSILNAFNAINESNIDADVLILARGGGSMEDLWIFNDPDIALALYRSKYPTISAVGHEIDFTLCDFVADKRAETPSAAAELLTHKTAELYDKLQTLKETINNNIHRIMLNKKRQLEYISYQTNYNKLKTLIENLYLFADSLTDKIISSMNNIIYMNKSHLQSLAETMHNNNPIYKLALYRQECGSYKNKITSDMFNIIYDKKNSVNFLRNALRLLNPENILKKGYTITTDKNGNTVKSANQIDIDDNIITIFQNGKASSTVNKVYRSKHPL